MKTQEGWYFSIVNEASKFICFAYRQGVWLDKL